MNPLFKFSIWSTMLHLVSWLTWPYHKYSSFRFTGMSVNTDHLLIKWFVVIIEAYHIIHSYLHTHKYIVNDIFVWSVSWYITLHLRISEFLIHVHTYMWFVVILFVGTSTYGEIPIFSWIKQDTILIECQIIGQKFLRKIHLKILS